MKIAIVQNLNPFQSGKTEMISNLLMNKLKEFGHETELIHIPFVIQNEKELIRQLKTVQLLHLQTFFDKVIALEIPACFVRHSNKTLWLVNSASFFQELEKKNIKQSLIRKFISFSQKSIGSCSGLFVLSKIDCVFLKKYLEKDCEILFPISNQKEEWERVVKKLIL